ncbi:MAG: outer membrane protein assembly factor BamE [Romboutsia sp.]|nr:outer membrane protein assembly factor BamE [Romboutsia sp.]
MKLNKFIIVTIPLFVACTLSLVGCVSVYKKDVQQGNYINQKMLDKLKIHQSKMEVQEILGSPALVPVFNLNRWDYHYYFVNNEEHTTTKKSLSLFFDQNGLSSYSGDWPIKNLTYRK